MRCVQEYIPVSASMHVSSFMHLVSMLMYNACASPETAVENRHLRTWLSVTTTNRLTTTITTTTVSHRNMPPNFWPHFAKFYH